MNGFDSVGRSVRYPIFGPGSGRATSGASLSGTQAVTLGTPRGLSAGPELLVCIVALAAVYTANHEIIDWRIYDSLILSYGFHSAMTDHPEEI